MTEIMPEVIAGGYCSPERAKAARDKEEQKRQAYGEAYAKKVIAEYPSLAPLYDHYVLEGKRRWSRKMYAPSKNEDYTSTFEYLDEKIEPSTQEFLEDIFNNEGIAPVEVEEPETERPMTRRWKFRNRPCLGCPDCRHWDYRKCECTNPAPKAEICEWISERYRERGE